MNKKEIQKEIENTREKLRELEKKLANAKDHSLSEIHAQGEINRVANVYADSLQAAGMPVSAAFGEITREGEFAERSIFLEVDYTDKYTSRAGPRTWKWVVITDELYQQVLVRVDKVTGECID